MNKELTFDRLAGMTGFVVLSCDDNGHSNGEYIVEEYDNDHGRISVSSMKDNKVTTLWPEDISAWHFRLPGTENYSKNSTFVNADINGSANILKKGKQNLDFEKVHTGFLASSERIRVL